tara:strand:- start:102 stop:1490 length:1389 start_codon:yes stop_codon:yes gene_type:complete
MASTYLARAHGSSTNTKQWSVSVWVKRAKLGYQCSIWGTGNSSGYYTTFLMFNSSDQLRFGNLGSGSPMDAELISNRFFRDTNAWYHIVVGVDSDQATASNRVKIYVNGEQITSWATNNQPSQGAGFRWNEATSTSGPSIGRTGHWNDRYFEGCMSHVHLIDGTQYAASDFGETDATTGEWKIKTAPSVTYGTNGAFILKDGNSGTDQSGQGNNWTANGTLTKSEDNPSNVFAVFNNLSNADATLTNGNTSCLTNSGSYADRPVMTSLGMTKGKYYCEMKAGTVNTGATWEYGIIGITGRPLQIVTGSEQYQHLGSKTQDFGYYAYNGHILNNSGSANTDTAYGNSWTTNDIIGVAVDIDNSKLYFSKNGVWQNSGDPTSGATGTGAISIDAVSSTTLGAYFFAVGAYHYTPRYNFYANFGNGYFGTTAVSSAGTNASNNGIFEYDVPSGYTALCTKGINSF